MDYFSIAQSRGWLADQPDDFKQALLSRSVVRKFAAGDTVTRYGDDCDGVYGLVSGVLKLELPLRDDFRLASSKHPVCWFGQAACLKNVPFLVSLTASTSVTAVFLPKAEFETLMETPSFCRCFALLTVDHYEEAIQALASLLINDTRSKVIIRLAQLAVEAGPHRPAVLRISQAELAEMCGVSRSTAVLVCLELQELGLLRTRYRRLEVMNPEALFDYQARILEAA